MKMNLKGLSNIRDKFSNLLNIPNVSKFIVPLLIFILGMGVGFALFTKQNPQNQANISAQKDVYVAFLLEIYDKVKENYWDNISDEQLTNLYKLASEKLTGSPQQLNIAKGKPTIPNPAIPTQILPGNELGSTLNLQGTTINDLKVLNQEDDKTKNVQKAALEEMLKNILKNLDEKQKKEFSVNLSAAVLSNLNPAGRSGLFTQKQEEQLKNTVQNVNPQKDLYKDLGLNKSASKEEAEKAYQEQSEKLSQDKSEQAKQKLKEIAYAKDVLTDQDKKKNYDEGKIEPTVFSKIYPPDIAYIKFLKFSPTTFDEFTKVVSSFDKPDGPISLIFDLRGNVGGAIDSLPYFLGSFLGNNQYAFDFMHKGEYLPFRTIGNKAAGLSRFKQKVILVDNQTQSSAELMAVTLKKYHAGIIFGVPTKGWGTVEKVFQLENQIDASEKYSMFLVHSITLRDDNQPIEGRGVEPDINIKDSNWPQELFSYFRNQEFNEVIKQVI